MSIATRRQELYAEFDQVLGLIPLEVMDRFAERWPLLAHRVNERMAGPAREQGLIGPNALGVMFDNHACHASFINSVVRMRSPVCLVEIVVWAYRSYLARGFEAAYFVAELRTWREVITEELGSEGDAAWLLLLYEHLEARHDAWLELAEEAATDDELSGPGKHFLDAILAGDERGATGALVTRIRAASELPRWWESVVTPAMRALGNMWARGEIGISDEHVATAIVRRVLDRSFPRLPARPRRDQLVAVVVTPGERHEIGARLVADALELYGFDTLFTGADTPVADIVALVEHHPVDMLLLSTTVPMNLAAATETVAAVREFEACPRIVVGGQAWDSDPDLWSRSGADSWVGSLGALAEMLAADP